MRFTRLLTVLIAAAVPLLEVHPLRAQAPSQANSIAAIPGVVAADAKVELVQEGFTFLEGPVGAPDGGLYFSDIMGANKTMRLDLRERSVSSTKIPTARMDWFCSKTAA